MDKAAVEERIHQEFARALEEREQAPPQRKLQAESLLNHAVRRLVDFVAHGKVHTER